MYFVRSSNTRGSRSVHAYWTISAHHAYHPLPTMSRVERWVPLSHFDINKSWVWSFYPVLNGSPHLTVDEDPQISWGTPMHHVPHLPACATSLHKISVMSIPVTSFQSTGPVQSNASRRCLQLLPWPLQVSPTLPVSSSIILLQLFLGHSLLSCPWGFQLDFLWQRYSSSTYDQSTSISAVWFSLPMDSQVHTMHQY